MTPEQIDITFSRLSQLSRAYGAPAIEAAERVLQRDALGQLIGGGVYLVGGAFLGIFAAACIRNMRENHIIDQPVLIGLGSIFGATIGSLLAAAGIVSGIVALSDVWAWTALTDPSLALAHDIYQSMGGH
jgi:hypothetical protein